MNKAAKGNRRERQSKAILEASGYDVTKAGASLGIWDLVGVGSTDFVLCQVKSRDWPYGAEMETLLNYRCPPNCRKIIHRWRDRQREPDVRVLQ